MGITKLWKKHHVILFIRCSHIDKKLEEWKKFQNDWNSTFREHLLTKGWSEDVIDIYESAYVQTLEKR